MINWNHPISKGLIFDAPLLEGGGTNATETINKIKGSIDASGATWDKNIFGNDLDFSASASRIVYVSPATLNTLGILSIEVMFTIRGAGGGNLGRLVHKKNNSAGRFQIQAGSSEIRFVVSGTGNSAWGITQPSLGPWHHYVVTYDGVTDFINDVPIVYLDGIRKALSTSTQPTVAWVADSTDFYIGNTAAGTRNWNGKIAYVRIWNRILGPAEVKQLYSNPWQIYVKSWLSQPLDALAAAIASSIAGWRNLMGVGQ